MEYEVYLACNVLGVIAIILTFFYHYVAAKPPESFDQVPRQGAMDKLDSLGGLGSPVDGDWQGVDDGTADDDAANSGRGSKKSGSLGDVFGALFGSGGGKSGGGRKRKR